MTIEAERIATLEAESKSLHEQCNDIWNTINSFRNGKFDELRKECEERMDKKTKSLERMIEQSWNRMMLILKIFIPICMLLFSILAGQTFRHNEIITENKIVLREIKYDMNSQTEVNKQILVQLKKLNGN